MKANYRGIPTTKCPCGCDLIKILAIFDPDTYEIAWHTLQGHCYSCGAMLTVPCPVDKEN